MRSPNLPIDKHLLNFSTPITPNDLPAGLQGDLSLMVGAGDLEHGGIPNVEKFHQFDVFFCNGWDIEGSLQRNVDYINEFFPGKKVICVVDYEKKEEVNRFISIFANRFALIDGHGGHTPHFTITELRKIMVVGGEAMNIFEQSENMMLLDDAIFWLENGYPRTFAHSNTLLTARIYTTNSPGMRLTTEQTDDLRRRFTENIIALNKKNKRTIISAELLDNLPSLSLENLQQILVSIMYDIHIHLDMLAIVRMNKRLWRENASVDLVLKKVPVNYMEEKVAMCQDTVLKERAVRIITKIKEELENGMTFPPAAKYNTLLKHVTSDKFEAACEVIN